MDTEWLHKVHILGIFPLLWNRLPIILIISNCCPIILIYAKIDTQLRKVIMSHSEQGHARFVTHFQTPSLHLYVPPLSQYTWVNGETFVAKILAITWKKKARREKVSLEYLCSTQLARFPSTIAFVDRPATIFYSSGLERASSHCTCKYCCLMLILLNMS